MLTLNVQALHMCSECLLLLEECPELAAVQEMNQSIEVRLILLLFSFCRLTFPFMLSL